MSDVNVRTIPASQISREVAEAEYNKLISGNEYKPNLDEYSATHPNALSDGDDRGKGETTTIGSKTDIAERTKLMAANIYSQNKPYTNPG